MGFHAESGRHILDGVSMKSGLRDRNNALQVTPLGRSVIVSMKSGLRDRNNSAN